MITRLHHRAAITKAVYRLRMKSRDNRSIIALSMPSSSNDGERADGRGPINFSSPLRARRSGKIFGGIEQSSFRFAPLSDLYPELRPLYRPPSLFYIQVFRDNPVARRDVTKPADKRYRRREYERGAAL